MALTYSILPPARKLTCVAAALVITSCNNGSPEAPAKNPPASAAQPETGNRVNNLVLSCDGGYQIKARYHTPDADGLLSRLSLEINKGGVIQKLEMIPAIAASGAKFETVDQSLSFWEHQGEFVLAQGDTDLSVCQEPIKERELTTKTGKTFVVKEDNTEAASLSKVTITVEGLPEGRKVIELGERDPVAAIFLGDLDQDGFEELYLITRSVGTGSYATLYGLASNRDTSVTEITMPEISDADEQPGALFEGYLGSDSFYIDNATLVREFPVYQNDDTSPEPTGDTRRVYYSLTSSDKGPVLVPTKAEQVK